VIQFLKWFRFPWRFRSMELIFQISSIYLSVSETTMPPSAFSLTSDWPARVQAHEGTVNAAAVRPPPQQYKQGNCKVQLLCASYLVSPAFVKCCPLCWNTITYSNLFLPCWLPFKWDVMVEIPKYIENSFRRRLTCFRVALIWQDKR
jgi:hypothetical protein